MYFGSGKPTVGASLHAGCFSDVEDTERKPPPVYPHKMVAPTGFNLKSRRFITHCGRAAAQRRRYSALN